MLDFASHTRLNAGGVASVQLTVRPSMPLMILKDTMPAAALLQ
jgi:hypothetical protein